jgi:long-chain acyl-CoA synthetase
MSFAPPFDNLVTMLQTSVARFGQRPVFGVKRGGQWMWISYRELGRMVDELRGGLAQLGVGRGDRVAVISNNRLEWAVGCHATYSLGAIYVPMYENQLDKELKYILHDSGAKLALCGTDEITGRVGALRGDLPELQHILNFDGRLDDPTSYAAILRKGAERPVPAVVPAGTDVAGFTYTSGTTGNPKGVMLTHVNLASNIAAITRMVQTYPDDRSLGFLPWAHVFGGSAELHGMLSFGGSIAICEAMDQILPSLAEVKPTLLFAVPRIWNRIYDGVNKQMTQRPKIIQSIFQGGMAARSKQKRGQKLALAETATLLLAQKLIFSKVVARFGGRLRVAISGAAALSRDVAEFVDNLGVTVCEGYGMTELSPCATTNTPDIRRIGSVGKPIVGVNVKLDHTATGATDEIGEIVVYGHGVMKGYWNNPEETAKVLTADGGMRTGDLGRFDADGFLYITGRVKELYKLENGKYVAPAPIEEQITLSPFIAQCMVHGADRPHNVALVVPDMEALKGWAKGQGIDASGDGLLANSAVRKLIQGEIDRAMQDGKGFERIRNFALIHEAFSQDNDMLTPTLKVKRRNVLKRYEAQLNALYS